MRRCLPAGGAWGVDGMTITFAPNRSAGLVRVSSNGGKPESLTTLGEGQVTHRWPQMLPGGKGVLFTAHTRVSGFNDANLEVQPLPTGARKVVQRGAFYGRYLASGHLVYVRDGTLFAAPFDLDRLELTKTPVPILEGVTTTTYGAAQFAVSDNGTLGISARPKRQHGRAHRVVGPRRQSLAVACDAGRLEQSGVRVGWSAARLGHF